MGQFFAEPGIDCGPTGWITDEGKFIPCSPMDHDKVAQKETGRPVSEIEKIWIRISILFGINHLQFCGERMNKKQIKALDDWGLIQLMEKKRAKISMQFYKAYFGD